MNKTLSIALCTALTAFALATAAPAQAEQTQTADTHTLTLNITGIEEVKGTMMISLEQKEGDKVAPVSRAANKVTGKTMTHVFPNLPAGDYSVMLWHDENDNKKMDSNFIGIPTEGYGASNNPKVMRKPTFDETKFEVNADTSIDVRIN